jgi:hypothetical protein
MGIKNDGFYINKDIQEIKLDDNLFTTRKTKFEPSREFIIRSLNIIKELWNKNNKSRNFIKHLISNFIPINYFNKVSKFETTLDGKINIKKCAILGFKLVSINELILTLKELDPLIKEIKESGDNSRLSEIDEFISKQPIEIKEYSIAYYSPNTDKYLSIHALNALNYFTEQGLLIADKDILFTTTKMRLNDSWKIKKLKITNTEINTIAKISSFGVKDHHLSSKEYQDLEKIKTQLKYSK